MLVIVIVTGASCGWGERGGDRNEAWPAWICVAHCRPGPANASGERHTTVDVSSAYVSYKNRAQKSTEALQTNETSPSESGSWTNGEASYTVICSVCRSARLDVSPSVLPYLYVYDLCYVVNIWYAIHPYRLYTCTHMQHHYSYSPFFVQSVRLSYPASRLPQHAKQVTLVRGQVRRMNGSIGGQWRVPFLFSNGTSFENKHRSRLFETGPHFFSSGIPFGTKASGSFFERDPVRGDKQTLTVLPDVYMYICICICICLCMCICICTCIYI